MLTWTDVERDTITELLNLGMGKAAKALSELLHEEILLSIPQVEFVSRLDATKFMEKLAPKELVSVRQEFAGPFGGSAILLFSGDDSLELVRALLSGDIILEDLPDLEQEAVSEVGNIVLNACLSSLADALGQEIPTDLPIFHKGPPRSLLEQEVESDSTDNEMFLLSNIKFELKSLEIVGYLALFLCLASARTLKHELSELYNSFQVVE